MLPINCSLSGNELVVLIINGATVIRERRSNDQLTFKKGALVTSHMCHQTHHSFNQAFIELKERQLQKQCIEEKDVTITR